MIATIPLEWSMDASYFAGRLRELRESKGMSREELAEAAGLSVGGVRDLEQGHRHPTWSTAIALCEALGVTPDAFIQEPAERLPMSRGRPRRAPGRPRKAQDKTTGPKTTSEPSEPPERGRRKKRGRKGHRGQG